MDSTLTRGTAAEAAAAQPQLSDLLLPLVAHWGRLIVVPLLVGSLAVGGSFLVKPTFTARTSFLPPQQQQSVASAALASLGALAGLMGGGRGPADQYVALMQSTTVSDRIIDQFKLMEVYDTDLRVEARKTLGDNVGFAIGKKDGLITVEVDDKDPKRAAAMANAYIEELRRLTNVLAVSEAQQRRVFFETQLQQTKQKLTAAQVALEATGITAGALKAEPKAAAETYARLRAELTAAEVRLQSLRSALADSTPEVRRMQETVAALRGQLSQAERVNTQEGGGADYVGKYREFKYQETLFELLARQYELARVDEAREGALIQVVDNASPPEKKTRPRRSIYGIVGAISTFLLYAAFLIGRARVQHLREHDAAGYARWQAFKNALKP